MAYATQEQIEDAAGGAARLLQLCDDGAGAIDESRLAQAQLHADMLIDGHSRMRFAELVDSNDAIVDTAIALAAVETVYQLKCQLAQNTANDDNLADARLLIYEKIGNGTFRPSEPLPASSTSVESAWTDRADENADGTGRVTRETLKGVCW